MTISEYLAANLGWVFVAVVAFGAAIALTVNLIREARSDWTPTLVDRGRIIDIDGGDRP